jgi:hypothetical protein
MQRMVRMSVTAGFRDAEGHWIGLTSHRHDDDGFARLRQRAPLNASMAADRAAGQDPAASGAGALRGSGRSPRKWQEAAILVDDEATPFELCHLEGGFWAAVGRAPGADVTIDSRGVPLDGLVLERIPDPPPEMHTPPPPPPQASERFPDELRDSTISDRIPPATVVDLVYRNSSRLTGKCRSRPGGPDGRYPTVSVLADRLA